MGIPAETVQAAARAVADADALLIGAGAGMGVDSGLPDFRGSEGFWNAYPRYRELGMSFSALANPRWFAEDPELAWGFYGHRMHLYRDTAPHAGFALLRAWAARTRLGAAVYTSNVDGQFQRAGFPAERVYECHGSIHHVQCLRGCGLGVAPADGYTVQIDDQTLRARRPLPACPRCAGLVRPNILMFGDGQWDDRRSHAQGEHLETWLGTLRGARLCVIECGAGVAIPSVRRFCAALARQHRATLIRINPREADADHGGYTHLALGTGALAGLQAIGAALPS